MDMNDPVNNLIGIVKVYNIFGYLFYCKGAYDSAGIYLNRAWEAENKMKLFEDQFFTAYWLGALHIRLSNFEKSEHYFDSALQAAEKTNNNDIKARANLGLGVYYYTRGDYVKGLIYYLRSDSLLGSKVSIVHADILQNIGQVHHALDNYKLERVYLEKANKMYAVLHDQYGLNEINLRLGSIEQLEGNYKQAESYFRLALPYFKRQRDNHKTGEIMTYLGEVKLQLKQYNMSLAFFKNAISLLKSNPADVMLLRSYRGLGDAYYGLGQFDAAVHGYSDALAISDHLGELSSKSITLKKLAHLYAQEGEYINAYKIQNEFVLVEDSLNKIKSSKLIHEMEAQYRGEKERQEVELLRTKNQLREKKVKNQRMLFALSFTGILFLALFFYYLYRVNQRSNKKLKELDQLRSRFFTNISHEFRTP